VREALERFRTRAPIIGPLTRALAVSRFCRILGTMLANSIPMLPALQIAKDAAGNTLLERAIAEATESVRQGQALAPPLGASGLFPEEIVEMIAVGESANNLDEVLLTVAETVDRRVDRMLGTAVRLIEPLMLLVLAGVIALVAMALILPMTRMSQNL
jgi:general secretion pathway protein F